MDGTLVDSMWGWNDVYVSFLCPTVPTVKPRR